MKRAKRARQSKPYWKMNLKELEEATKEFDGPIDLAKTRPLSKTERARWERSARRGSVSITALCNPASLSMNFDERFLLVSMREAARDKKPLYDVMESTFRTAIEWFQRTWAPKKRRGAVPAHLRRTRTND